MFNPLGARRRLGFTGESRSNPLFSPVGRGSDLAQDSGQIAVGVVGLGYFGSHHARHSAAHAGARLVAVVDADAERACGAATKYGAAAHADHRDLVGKVEAVSITVPTSLHYAIACDLIDAGIHLFIEKPIAAEVADAADLVARAARRGSIVQVGHIERFSPAFRALQAEVRAPRLIECVRRAPWTGRASDVDVVLDLMIHDIDLALALAGAPVASVAASGVSVRTGLNDVAEARLTFQNGVVATLATSRVAATGERTLAVTEPGRRLVADLANPGLAIVNRGAGAVTVETVSLAHADNLFAEIDAFLGSVRTGSPPVVDGAAGLDALGAAAMILEAISAAQQGAPLPHNGVRGA